MTRAVNHAGRLVTLVLLGLALASLSTRPTNLIEWTVLGSPLAIGLSGATLITVLLVALTCVGVEEMVRAHPSMQGAPLAYSLIFWPLPAIVTLAAALLVPTLYGRLIWVAGLGLTFLALSIVLLGQYQGIDPEARYYDRARLFITLIAYFSAFFLYAAVTTARVRSLVSASAILLVSVVLALTLLRGAASEWPRAWTYATACGLVLGELTWALNYWPIGPIGEAALLLLAFYLVTGLAQQALTGRITRRVLIEFVLVGGLLFIVILRFSPWLG